MHFAILIDFEGFFCNRAKVSSQLSVGGGGGGGGEGIKEGKRRRREVRCPCTVVDFAIMPPPHTKTPQRLKSYIVMSVCVCVFLVVLVLFEIVAVG